MPTKAENPAAAEAIATATVTVEPETPRALVIEALERSVGVATVEHIQARARELGAGSLSAASVGKTVRELEAEGLVWRTPGAKGEGEVVGLASFGKRPAG